MKAVQTPKTMNDTSKLATKRRAPLVLFDTVNQIGTNTAPV